MLFLSAWSSVCVISTWAWRFHSLFYNCRLLLVESWSLFANMQSFFFLFFFTTFSGNGVKQNAQNSYPGLCIFGLHGLCLCLTSSFPLWTLSNILFVLIFIYQTWYKSICYLSIPCPQTPNVTGSISVKWLTLTLPCLSRCQSWRMGYIPALQEPGTFIWKIQMMCMLSLSCIMCCVCLMHAFSHLFDRSLQIFRKFVGKLKQRLNAAQVTTRWKESIGVNSVMP